MRLFLISYASMGVALGVAACSDGGVGGSAGATGGGRGDTFEPSLPSDRMLGTLTAAESAQLCRELQAFFTTGKGAAGIHELQCRSGAVLATRSAAPMSEADVKQACKASYDACRSAPAVAAISSCEQPSASCMASVKQFATCLSDTADYFSELAESVSSCSELTLQNLQSAGHGAAEQPQSCAVVKSFCPEGLTLPSGT